MANVGLRITMKWSSVGEEEGDRVGEVGGDGNIHRVVGRDGVVVVDSLPISCGCAGGCVEWDALLHVLSRWAGEGGLQIVCGGGGLWRATVGRRLGCVPGMEWSKEDCFLVGRGCGRSVLG